MADLEEEPVETPQDEPVETPQEDVEEEEYAF